MKAGLAIAAAVALLTDVAVANNVYGKYPPAPKYGQSDPPPDNYYDPEPEEEYSPPEYNPPEYNPPAPSPVTYHDYDSYPSNMYSDDYEAYNVGGYAPEVHHTEEPYPTITLEDEPPLRLPNLGQHHCFLQGAPWTNCGGKSLREFFLDQCMSLFFRMSTSVDALCVGPARTRPPPPAPTTTTPAPTQAPEEGYGYSNSYGSRSSNAYGSRNSNRYGYKATPKPTPKPKYYAPPTEEPYVAPIRAPTYCDVYYEERCLQVSYLSITLATVQCLTENSIRVLYIEKYAAAAASNPVEGPILYLKKLHEFVSNVIACNPDKVGNYPTIWRRFTSQLGVSYWPTAPFTMGSNNQINIPRCTSRQASGWDKFSMNGRFYCPHQDLLVSGGIFGDGSVSTYASDKTDAFYSATVNRLSTPGSCTAATYDYMGIQPLLKQCQVNLNSTETIGHQYSNPNTLRGLLDSVRVWDSASKANVRPRMIAEIIAHNQGTVKQPILEGNGILYFCSFYACRANNNGDLSSCFPSVSNSDWQLPRHKVDYWNSLTDDIQECLDEQWITSDDVSEVAMRVTQELSQRTHACQAEAELVRFFQVINGAFDPKVQDGHWVFLRQIAYERCNDPSYWANLELTYCNDVKVAYNDVLYALRKIKNRCISRMASYKAPQPVDPYKKAKPSYRTTTASPYSDYEATA